MYNDQRLITFGCSLTYGHGLEDCINIRTKEPGKTPSKFAYPQILKEKLGFKDVVNLSTCGSSNKYIAEKILSFDFYPNDVIIVQWSYLQRWHLWIDMEQNKDAHFGFLNNGRLEKGFYAYYFDDETSYIENTFVIDLAFLHLKQLGNKFYMTWGHKKGTENIFVKHTNFLESNIGLTRNKFPLALDDSHPGPGAHRAHAEDLIAETEGFTI